MTHFTKASLRKEHLALRRSLSPAAVRRNSELITLSLLEFLPPLAPSLVCSYLAYDNEPDLSSLPSRWAGMEFYYPVTSNGRTLSFFRMTLGDRIIKDSKGIPIPEKRDSPLPEQVNPSKIVFLVPGICFSAGGARIGSGCGYYDRYLSRYNGQQRPILIGIAHDCQISQLEWEQESNDIPMDHVITEKRILHREVPL
jgi:5-formyltetrahydrofolate cyclo-ligase